MLRIIIFEYLSLICYLAEYTYYIDGVAFKLYVIFDLFAPVKEVYS